MQARASAMKDGEPEQLYQISAVARLTGLPAPNIRIWEKRYGAVVPQRTDSKRRLYSAGDIQRLTFLKALVDRGHAIGTIAPLSNEQLEWRLRSERSVTGRADAECRIYVVGPRLQLQSADWPSQLAGTVVVGSSSTLNEAVAASEEADVLVVECATLFAEDLPLVQDLVEQLGAVRAVIVYEFAQQATLKRIERGLKGITALQAPVKNDELRVVLGAEKALAGSTTPLVPIEEGVQGDIPARLFTDHQLAAAAQLSTAIECECPQHLGRLLSSLTAFEAYSAACESRSPEDEALHSFLHQTTAEARLMMEKALAKLIEAEGIRL